MPDIQYFRLPDAGEGLTEADIVAWKVGVGDQVTVNQVLVEIETAKSLVELPCPFTGRVVELLEPEGATVAVGTRLIAVDTATASGTVPVVGPDRAPNPRSAVLVGYGPVAGAPRSRRPIGAARPLAKPPVRKLARDLGLDLRNIPPTGAGGVITRRDVSRAAVEAGPLDLDALAGGTTSPIHAVPSPGPAGEEPPTRIPVRGVRRAMATAMVASAFTAPHAAVWLQVDLTRTMKLVRRLRQDPVFAGIGVGPLLLLARSLVTAVRDHPEVNARWDDDSAEIVVLPGVNLGLAVATERGLVVPNIPHAERLSLRDLARDLARVTETARAGRTTPAEQTGGTITLTNVGVFGVDGGTPILNPPEAAILAVGQIARRPWIHHGAVRPRWVVTLTLSFDHRLIDGRLASQVLTQVAEGVNDPLKLVLGTG